MRATAATCLRAAAMHSLYDSVRSAVSPVPTPQVLGLEPPQPVPHDLHGGSMTSCPRPMLPPATCRSHFWGINMRPVCRLHYAHYSLCCMRSVDLYA